MQIGDKVTIGDCSYISEIRRYSFTRPEVSNLQGFTWEVVATGLSLPSVGSKCNLNDTILRCGVRIIFAVERLLITEKCTCDVKCSKCGKEK